MELALVMDISVEHRQVSEWLVNYTTNKGTYCQIVQASNEEVAIHVIHKECV